ncbi:MAG: serine--tRNA ligase, partial [Flavobacteriaceae bacterium]
QWLEISSVSTFESFQSERLQLRYRTKDGQKMNVHTLNGSALALPRVMATLLENGQTEKGIVLPDVLVPYTGFDLID